MSVSKNSIVVYSMPVNRISSVLLLITVCSGGFAGGWKQVGFAGQEITGIIAGNDAFRQEQAVFFPVKDSGIYIMTATDDSTRRFPNTFMADDKPVGTVHSLHVSADGVEAFAGTDSGLYMESLNFASLPAWRRVSALPSVPVYGIASSDSAYCVMTKNELYQSKSGYSTWARCSLFTPSSETITSYAALTVWQHIGFIAATVTEANPPAFESVLLGNPGATIWGVMSDIEGCTDLDQAVLSLSTDTTGMLYAGTAKGVFFGWDFDTGCWHPVNPQLPMPVKDVKPYSAGSNGNPSDLFAATDSGLYLWSGAASSPGEWQKSLATRTSGVAVVTMESGVRFVYAATDDGIWKYDPASGVTTARPRNHIRNTGTGAMMYTLDGKVMKRRTGADYRGICIMVNKELCTGPVVRCMTR